MTSSFSCFVSPAVMLPRNNCRCDCTTLELLPQPLVFSSWIACHAIMTPHKPAICFRGEKGQSNFQLNCSSTQFSQDIMNQFSQVCAVFIMSKIVCDAVMTPHGTAGLLSRGVVWKKFTGQSDFQLYHSIAQFLSPVYYAPIFSGLHVMQSCDTS
ncbi:Polyketide synthase 3 [Frankliniella fusca]|uniref:Polyketide synthase 3 n=1 Tax=Frankliniella fusca TaxID=407009 RepID=A0AAE1HKM2_9NEOP|nr:Polyketide synthase 3 [Frankliniella fusca]